MASHTIALDLALDLFDRRAKLFGPNHPDVLFGIANLAASHINCQQYNEAERLLLDGIKRLDRATEPEEHPRRIQYKSHLEVIEQCSWFLIFN